MRTQVLQGFVMVFFVTLAYYLGGTLAAASWVPFSWEPKLRGTIAIGWLITCIVGFIIGLINENKPGK